MTIDLILKTIASGMGVSTAEHVGDGFRDTISPSFLDANAGLRPER